MKLLKTVTSIWDGIIGGLAYLAGVVIVFMTLAVCWDVISRYFLGRGVGWVMEFAEYSLLWFTLLATAWILKGERHVKIDIVLTRCKANTQAVLNIITSTLTAIACIIIAWYSAVVTWGFFQRGEWLPSVVEPPAFLIYLVIPLGFALLFIQFLRRIYGYLGSRRASPNKE